MFEQNCHLNEVHDVFLPGHGDVRKDEEFSGGEIEGQEPGPFGHLFVNGFTPVYIDLCIFLGQVAVQLLNLELKRSIFTRLFFDLPNLKAGSNIFLWCA